MDRGYGPCAGPADHLDSRGGLAGVERMGVLNLAVMTVTKRETGYTPLNLGVTKRETYRLHEAAARTILRYHCCNHHRRVCNRGLDQLLVSFSAMWWHLLTARCFV